MTNPAALVELVNEYQAWVPTILDTRDVVRETYDSDGHRRPFVDAISARLVLDTLKDPDCLRFGGSSYSKRVIALARPWLGGETHGLVLTPAVSWSQIECHLRRCSVVVQAAVVCAFVHGESVERMMQRTGWKRGQAVRLRAKAAEFLHNVETEAADLGRGSPVGKLPASANCWAERDPHHRSARFEAHANAGRELRERASANRMQFWAEQANELLWDNDFSEVLDWSNPPFAKWFADGTLNVAVNCIDRHVTAGNGERVAIHWVGELDERRDITYRELQCDVSKAANYFADIGLRPRDRVAIYMPMIPEAIVSMLACARLGLVHVVVYVSLSAQALRSQLDDSQAKVVVTADGLRRGGLPAPVKGVVDEALAAGDAPCESVEKVVVVRHTGHDPELEWVAGRDVWWQDSVTVASDQHQVQSFGAEHPLFVLYASGSGSRPTGLVHSSGGYLTQVHYTFHYVFDHAEGRDVFWCGADLVCIAGHSYLVYGPLSNGATSVIYEGGAKFPDRSRLFRLIEEYAVTIFYVAPGIIRTCMGRRELAEAHDLSSLRLLGAIGERSNSETWRWYRDVIGGNRCTMVDTWWQIETGAVMIAPLPGLTAARTGSPVEPLPGISAHIVDEEGDLVASGEEGQLVLDRPWPSMVRGIWGDDERFVERYWSRFGGQGWYFTGVDASYDDDEVIWILSRANDVVTVAGHHVSSADVESALMRHSSVAEAAVVGGADETTGLAVVAFVSLRDNGADAGENLVADLRSLVATAVSPRAKPRDVHVVSQLPKTQSGNVMRYLLTEIMDGRN